MRNPFLTTRTILNTKCTTIGFVVGRFAMLHLYGKGIAPQKCYFDSSKPKSPIGSPVSQFDTPFSMLTSSNILDFSDRLFLN